MNILINLPILLSKDFKVDYDEIKSLVNKENSQGIYLFSSSLDGKLFSLKEKKDIVNNIKKITFKKIFYELSETVFEEEIALINNLKVDAVSINLFKDHFLKPKAFEKYVSHILKKIKFPAYLKIEDDHNNCMINYHNIVNIKRINKNFQGLILNTKDISFINKIKSINGLEIIYDFNCLFNDEIISDDFKDVLSSSYIVFDKEIDQYLFEMNKGYINPMLKEYISFINEVITLYPLNLSLKYLLSKKGYKSVYSKEPYFNLTNEEKEKLDYIF